MQYISLVYTDWLAEKIVRKDQPFKVNCNTNLAR